MIAAKLTIFGHATDELVIEVSPTKSTFRITGIRQRKSTTKLSDIRPKKDMLRLR